ncbi:hypothetical protein ACTWQB_08940 [Piscibacillus sp. B03]|uniref:hypothetical protein n=1 Tax=Piscibacillus sp. B03 TaxID=3457430 RepID=UPI003FCEDAA9
MLKKVALSSILLLALLLGACSGESRSNKEVMVDTYQSMMEMEKFDSTGTLDLNIDADVQDPFIAPYIQMINDMEFSVDQRMDMTQNLSEMVIHLSATMSPMTFNIDLPILQNLDTETIYIETDSLADNLGMFLGDTEQLRGKVLKLEMSELEGASEVEQVDYQEVQEQAQAILTDFLEDKSDDDFTKDGDTYITTFSKEELVDLFAQLVTEFDDTLTDEELQEGVTEMKTALEEVKVNTFETRVTLDGDQLESQEFILDLEFDLEGSPIHLNLATDTVYNSIGEDVEFTIDPENSELVEMEELMQMMNSMGY